MNIKIINNDFKNCNYELGFHIESEMTPIKIVNKLMNLINEMAQERLNLTTLNQPIDVVTRRKRRYSGRLILLIELPTVAKQR